MLIFDAMRGLIAKCLRKRWFGKTVSQWATFFDPYVQCICFGSPRAREVLANVFFGLTMLAILVQDVFHMQILHDIDASTGTIATFIVVDTLVLVPAFLVFLSAVFRQCPVVPKRSKD